MHSPIVVLDSKVINEKATVIQMTKVVSQVQGLIAEHCMWYLRVLLQKVCNCHGILRVLLHSEGQCLQTPMEEKGIERSLAGNRGTSITCRRSAGRVGTPSQRMY